MPDEPWKPTKEQVLAAAGKTLPDVIAPGPRVLFVGINPGLYTAAIGHHFGRPGNRFWPALYRSGFTPRLLSPFEESELLPLGLGITNFVARATATAAELTPDELRSGAAELGRKVEELRPRFVASVGVQSYRIGFGRPKAGVGLQPETLAGAKLWVLPNPSGLQAHYQLPELARLFAQLREAAGEPGLQ
ncbi:MAG TPA: G/U mismatch-specific DNA glycosylase [Chloroflexota bacterium]|nr:G/U mismatch-specific DNA glycosylase [Chloroflexota bacterium]